MKTRYSKAETKKYACAINHIRDKSHGDDSGGALAAMYCSGLTFTDEIDRFLRYCEVTEARDVIEAVRCH